MACSRPGILPGGTRYPVSLGMTTLLDDLLFALPDVEEKDIEFDAPEVRERLMRVVEDEDLRNYIL